jgi:hypothetical protein
MKIYLLLLGFGVLLYVAAFRLPAVFEPGSAPLRGYDCAVVTLIQVWTRENRALIHEEPLNYISLVISGWINPLFLISMILMPIRKAQKAVSIFRIIILLMIPFCWIVFYTLKVRPREGHFLWIFGMALALFANKFRKAANA